MFTLLFNRDQVEAYRLENEASKYRHTFGGKACHDGTTPQGCRKPVHLFYNLDLSDQRLGVHFPDSKLTHLPLYYALGNCGGPFCYRIVSDARIELFCQPYPKEYRAGIMKEYPEPFLPTPIELDPIDYDPNDPQHVWHSGGVLGIATLTARQKATLKKKLERWHLKNIGCPLVEKDDEDEPDPSLEQIVEGGTPFTQGMPRAKCPNPDCEQHSVREPLPVLLLVTPDEEDEFYARIAGGDSGLLIWQVCCKCASVVVTNPCT